MAAILNLFGGDKDPHEKIVKRFLSKTCFESVEDVESAIASFNRIARPLRPNSSPVIDWNRFVMAFGLTPSDFPADVTDRTRFLLRLFSLFVPSRGDRVIDLETFVTKLAAMHRGPPEQRGRILFKLFHSPDADVVSKESFRQMSSSMAETARQIALAAMLSVFEKQHRSPPSYNTRPKTFVSVQFQTQPPFQPPSNVERYNPTWSKSDDGEPAEFAKSSYTNYSPVAQFSLQSKSRALFEDLPSSNEGALVNHLFDEIFKKDRVKEKQFVEWIVEHSATTFSILTYYSKILITGVAVSYTHLTLPTN